MQETPLETLRLHQANERTMLAWVRTGIALMAFGFAIERFGLFLRQIAVVSHLEGSRPVGSAVLGLALVLLGVVTNAAATVRYRNVRRAIERGEVGAPSAFLVYGMGALITACGILMAFVLIANLVD